MVEQLFYGAAKDLTRQRPDRDLNSRESLRGETDEIRSVSALLWRGP